MDRAKTPKLVITFSTTTAAMMMDAACGAHLGRLIPIPGEISAGCGLAWCAGTEQKEVLLRLMKENDIAYQSIYTIEMY